LAQASENPRQRTVMANDSFERTPFPMPPTAAVGYSMRSLDDLSDLPSVLTSKEGARVLMLADGSALASGRRE
jgi:hypothetical protein